MAVGLHCCTIVTFSGALMAAKSQQKEPIALLWIIVGFAFMLFGMISLERMIPR